MKKEIRNRIVSLITTTIFLFSSTYIWFNYRTIRTNAENNYMGNMFLSLEEIGNNNYDDLFPVTDEEGLEQEGHIIKVKNNANYKTTYKLVFIPDSNNTLNNKFIKYSYNVNGGNYSKPKTIDNNLITVDSISNKNINTYNIKIWIDYNANNEVMNKTFSYKIGLESA